MNKKKAQQLVEFALVVPALLIVIMIIMEMGYAINVRSVLADSTKVAVNQAMQNFTGYDNPADNFLSELESSIDSVLSEKGFDQKIDFEIVDMPNSDKVMVIASTKYEPSFGLNNMFAGIIPQEFSLSTYQIVNRNYLEKNDVDNIEVLTEDQITHFWPNGPTGLLSDNPADIGGVPKSEVQKQVAFLIDVSDNNGQKARLFNWEGQDLLPVNSYFNLSSGAYTIKSPYHNNGAWMATDLTIEDVLISMGFTQGIYVKPQNLINIDSTDTSNQRKKTKESQDIVWSTQNIKDGSTDTRFGINLLTAGANALVGNYEKVNSYSDNRMSSNDIQEFIFKSENPKYLLKLYLPKGSLGKDPLKRTEVLLVTKDGDPLLDSSSKFNSLRADIVNYYVDTDGDYIPDKYDLNPECSDINMDGVLDGNKDENYYDFTSYKLAEYQQAGVPDRVKIGGFNLDSYLGYAYDDYSDFFFDSSQEDAFGGTDEQTENNLDIDPETGEVIDIDEILYDENGNPVDREGNPIPEVESYYNSTNLPLGDPYDIDPDNLCYGFGTFGREYRIKYLRVEQVSANYAGNVRFKNNFNNTYYAVEEPNQVGIAKIQPVKFEKIERGTFNLFGRTYCGFTKDKETYEPLYYCDSNNCYRKVTSLKPALGVSTQVKREILNGLSSNYTLDTTPEVTSRTITYDAYKVDRAEWVNPDDYRIKVTTTIPDPEVNTSTSTTSNH